MRSGEMVCVGSVDELRELSGQELDELDLHRPYVDAITFENPNGEGGTMRRVPEVIDVWFDSGAMQVAQWAYPQNEPRSCSKSNTRQTIFAKLWIKPAVGSIVCTPSRPCYFETVAFKNVISLGHILDEKGQKMSTSKGNVVDPWVVLDEAGADAFRWLMYTSGPPGEPRRFSKNLVNEVIKKFWSTLWNTYSFFVTYANIDSWTPAMLAPPPEERELLDRWLLGRVAQI